MEAFYVFFIFEEVVIHSSTQKRMLLRFHGHASTRTPCVPLLACITQFF